MSNEELLEQMQELGFSHPLSIINHSTMLQEKSAQIDKLQKMLMWYVEENMTLINLLDRQQEEIAKLTMEKHNEST